MDLAVLEEIKQLKYRYLRTLDLKRWDEFEATFVPEATGDYGEGLRFGSREEIVAFMRDSLGPLEHTGYQRTYEMTTSMDDQPGLTLKVGQAYNG